MVKGNYTFSLDIDLMEEAKTLWPNQISTNINEILRSTIGITKRDSKSIKIRLEKKKLDRLLGEYTKMKAEINETKRLISDYEELKKKEEEAKLKKEKEEIEQQKVCVVCGGLADRKFKNEPICKNCFMNK